jgi:hypothetical protein
METYPDLIVLLILISLLDTTIRLGIPIDLLKGQYLLTDHSSEKVSLGTKYRFFGMVQFVLSAGGEGEVYIIVGVSGLVTSLPRSIFTNNNVLLILLVEYLTHSIPRGGGCRGRDCSRLKKNQSIQCTRQSQQYY